MDYLLWYSGTDAPVAARVAQAARFYEIKFGRKPTRCLLPKEEVGPGPIGLTCVRDPLVLPGHIWIGSE